MDRPLSQLIAPELIFERPEEGPRCGKQRIVFLKPAKYSIGFPCSLYPGMRCPTPSTASGTALLIAARTCWSLVVGPRDQQPIIPLSRPGSHLEFQATRTRKLANRDYPVKWITSRLRAI
jgi:hypothetical protein